MRNLNQDNITEAVLGRFADCDDERLKTVLGSLVRHLHNFLRETRPTEGEWAKGIEFLTETGQMCDDERQEFILLSDTLGVTMLVDAINHPTASEKETESTVLGPFYVDNPPEFSPGSDIDREHSGELLYVEGTVTDNRGQPLPGVTVDVWQSDSEGSYDIQKPELHGHSLRARFLTDDQGQYSFWTVMPASYPIPTDGPVGSMLKATGRHPYRPAHVHFMLQANGYEKLVTQVFAEHDPYLDSDAVFGVKDSLVSEYQTRPAETAPDGRLMSQPYRYLRYDFGLKSL